MKFLGRLNLEFLEYSATMLFMSEIGHFEPKTCPVISDIQNILWFLSKFYFENFLKTAISEKNYRYSFQSERF